MGYRAIIAGGGTGGHLYPALNIAAALERSGGNEINVLLIGAKRGIESRVLPNRGREFRLLPFEPIYRSRPWRNWRLLPSAIKSVREVREIFQSFEPHVVIGTGGYAAGPVVALAVASHIPTAIQEQNSRPGLTTRWLAPYVDQLHLGYEEAVKMLWPGPKTLVRVHGNPIRWPEERPNSAIVRAELGLGPGRIVLVVGGSQGAVSLNSALLAALSRVRQGELAPLPADAQLLWSTGQAHYDDVSLELERLGGHLAVRTLPYVVEMEKALSVSTLAVSRAGAITLAELCAWGVPAILVPLPHAAADHQRVNARSLAADGAAVLVEETDITANPQILWERILHLLAEPRLLSEMGAASRARGNPLAAADIATDIFRLMEDR